jgi:hypothetical protein
MKTYQSNNQIVGTTIRGMKILSISDTPYIRPCGRKESRFNVLCVCGKEFHTTRGNIIYHNIKSCGCLSEAKRLKTMTTQNGLARHPLYFVYHQIKRRCYNPKSKNYSDYGGRGITMCAEWKESFMAFYHWVSLNGYREGLSIDRRHNDGNYCPDNCRLVDQFVQSNNTRRNILFELNGVTKTLGQWANGDKKLYDRMYDRIFRRHWSFEKAMYGKKFERNISTKIIK